MALNQIRRNGGGGGKPSPSPKGDSLIEGAVPMYKGDVQVDLETEEPVVVTIFGPPALGKTHMAFTFPHVACCDTEMKGEKVWKKFFNKQFPAYHINPKTGEVESYMWDDVDVGKSRLFHAEDWGDVASFYKNYIDDAGVQTLMFDSESDMRVMAENWTQGEVGHKLYSVQKGAGRVQYRLVYAKLLHILQTTKRMGKNLVYVAKSKDKYLDDSLIEFDGLYDGYKKQEFYSGYFLKMCEGVVNEKGEVLYKDHVFCKVLKCENMEKSKYPPYLIDCSYKGVIEELVRGTEWEGSLDDYIRDVVGPRMDVLGVQR